MLQVLQGVFDVFATFPSSKADGTTLNRMWWLWYLPRRLTGSVFCGCCLCFSFSDPDVVISVTSPTLPIIPSPHLVVHLSVAVFSIISCTLTHTFLQHWWLTCIFILLSLICELNCTCASCNRISSPIRITVDICSVAVQISFYGEKFICWLPNERHHRSVLCYVWNMPQLYV